MDAQLWTPLSDGNVLFNLAYVCMRACVSYVEPSSFHTFLLPGVYMLLSIFVFAVWRLQDFSFFFFTHHLYQSVHLKSLPRDKSWQMQIIQTFMCCNTFVVELNGKYKLNGVFKKNITCFYSFNLMLVCCILVFASTLCVCKRYIHSSRGQYDRWLWSSV